MKLDAKNKINKYKINKVFLAEADGAPILFLRKIRSTAATKAREVLKQRKIADFFSMQDYTTVFNFVMSNTVMYFY